MKITLKFLQEQEACKSGIAWWQAQKETDGLKVVKKLIVEDKLSWANWLIVKIMEADKKHGYKMYISYAIYAVECVLHIYEKRYPNDKRPRKAIESAKKYIKNPSQENKEAAVEAARAAAWAAWAIWAADAERAAWAADAARAAWAAAEAATWATTLTTTWAIESAEAAMQKKILKYGIKLLSEVEG